MIKTVIFIALTNILNAGYIEDRLKEEKREEFFNSYKKTEQQKANEYNERKLKEHLREIKQYEKEEKYKERVSNKNQIIEKDIDYTFKTKGKLYISKTLDSIDKVVVRVNGKNIIFDLYEYETFNENLNNEFEVFCYKKANYQYLTYYTDCSYNIIY